MRKAIMSTDDGIRKTVGQLFGCEDVIITSESTFRKIVNGKFPFCYVRGECPQIITEGNTVDTQELDIIRVIINKNVCPECGSVLNEIIPWNCHIWIPWSNTELDVEALIFSDDNVRLFIFYPGSDFEYNGIVPIKPMLGVYE